MSPLALLFLKLVRTRFSFLLLKSLSDRKLGNRLDGEEALMLRAHVSRSLAGVSVNSF